MIFSPYLQGGPNAENSYLCSRLMFLQSNAEHQKKRQKKEERREVGRRGEEGGGKERSGEEWGGEEWGGEERSEEGRRSGEGKRRGGERGREHKGLSHFRCHLPAGSSSRPLYIMSTIVNKQITAARQSLCASSSGGHSTSNAGGRNTCFSVHLNKR